VAKITAIRFVRVVEVIGKSFERIILADFCVDSCLSYLLSSIAQSSELRTVAKRWLSTEGNPPIPALLLRERLYESFLLMPEVTDNKEHCEKSRFHHHMQMHNLFLTFRNG